MDKLSRREFLGTAIAATSVAATGALRPNQIAANTTLTPAFVINPSIKSPVDKVPLGKSGLKISVVGIGTGTVGVRGASNQTRLGQEGFNRLIRHSLDNGINFFDLADQYGSNPYFGRAVKGISREQYVVQTKVINRDPQKAKADIDRFLQELQTDYIDSLIIHVVTDPEWTTKYRGIMDVFSEAKEKGKIRAHGVTCHSFGALQAAAASDWVQLNQVRWNAKRAHMDADVETVRALFQKMRGKGQGMIGMKVVGQGDIIKGEAPMTPDACFRFQIESGVVDAFVVGVESTEQIDHLLRGTQVAINELGYRAPVFV